MKRDMDLIRAILLKVEELPAYAPPPPMIIDGQSKTEVYYHAQLAVEAGLVEGDFTDQPDFFFPYKLTWMGHEFLDAARQDTFWNRWKGTLIDNGVSVTFESLKTVLPVIVKRMTGAV